LLGGLGVNALATQVKVPSRVIVYKLLRRLTLPILAAKASI
jgi:hypothetical protein